MINRDRNLFLHTAENVTVITSGEAGVGKTWFALTFAQALHHLRRKVLLTDADNGLQNIAFQLGISPENGLDRVMRGTITLNQAVYPVNKRKFDIISAPAGSDALADSPAGRLQILRDDFKYLLHNYDEAIIDAASNEKIIRHFIVPNAELLLLCSNEPADLVSTYDFLQKISADLPYKQLQIVVNYANSYEDGLQTYNILRHACEQYINTVPRLLGVIRRDTRVRDAIRNHVMMLSRYPEAEASQDVMNIARKFLKDRIKT